MTDPQGGIGIVRHLPVSGDAVGAAELLKNRARIRETISPIAGTYRFVVHFDLTTASDSAVSYADLRQAHDGSDERKPSVCVPREGRADGTWLCTDRCLRAAH